MCDDICICIAIGCPTKIGIGGGDGQARVCPKCNNGSVFQANSRMWIEICFIPLVPCRSKDIWHCNICNWQAELGSFQPILASNFGQPPPGFGPPMQPIYAPPQPIPPMNPYAPPPPIPQQH
ncbi:hypothetical protein BY996DRAFT_6431048 [Phakopsora pachyrhizi]|uniref:Zinc-ribbon 15 domain-containing protein n=1 Tax=Phakopsora pachyrhizi TaxID=170000 RepID=A0AAV0BKD3_PHAPC|nr:hypothetical protein BY996DRAFT_6431048 [Phakopsora pachyrhizi]CAH7687043.1 hypothetical protein PPACK8108_LOCUS21771 [Phakopsora pachyrhizi]